MKTVLTRGKTRAFQTRRFFEFETNTEASILKSTVVYHLNGKNRFVNGLGIWWAKMPGLVIYILLTYNRPIYRERLGRARPDPWFQEVKNRPLARFSHMVQKSHMLGRKLYSGKTKQRQVKVDFHELLCFGSPTVQLASQDRTKGVFQMVL